MAKAKQGNLVLLKMGDGDSPVENFVTLGGMRATQLAIQYQPVADADVESGAWRSLLAQAGQARLRIKGAGIYCDEAAQYALLQQALSREAKRYQFCFAGGDVLEGAFVITNYERIGSMREAEGFSVMLESSGTPVLTVAS